MPEINHQICISSFVTAVNYAYISIFFGFPHESDTFVLKMLAKYTEHPNISRSFRRWRWFSHQPCFIVNNHQLMLNHYYSQSWLFMMLVHDVCSWWLLVIVVNKCFMVVDDVCLCWWLMMAMVLHETLTDHGLMEIRCKGQASFSMANQRP